MALERRESAESGDSASQLPAAPILEALSNLDSIIFCPANILAALTPIRPYIALALLI